jgi:hypothetical protein
MPVSNKALIGFIICMKTIGNAETGKIALAQKARATLMTQATFNLHFAWNAQYSCCEKSQATQDAYFLSSCKPHSVLPSPDQRPALRPSPGCTGRVHRVTAIRFRI